MDFEFAEENVMNSYWESISSLLEVVGVDSEGRKIGYLGNQLFIRIDQEEKVYDIMEFPINQSIRGEVPVISLDAKDSSITWKAPLCGGFQTIIGKAIYDTKEGQYHLYNFAGEESSKGVETSISHMVEHLRNSKNCYGNGVEEMANRVASLSHKMFQLVVCHTQESDFPCRKTR